MGNGSTEIQIVEKPDWVSWEDIKQCLMDAHETNKSKGINMAHYQWPVERIKESLGEKGVMFVALDGSRVVGTAAIGDKTGSSWYAPEKYAYMCFACVLPEYRGRGVYKELIVKREEVAKDLGFRVLLLDTHERNKRIQDIALKNGYKYVRFFRAKSNDHYSVVMVKWIDGCPYSKLYCLWKYYVSKIKAVLGTCLS